MRLLAMAFLLLATVPARGGELRLQPRRIAPGGVVRLRYQGPPPQLAVARWRGRLVYLTPDATGAVALLGADLALPAGRYPLVVAVAGARGGTQFFAASVEVAARPRPVERLQLPRAMVSPRRPRVLSRIDREVAMLKALFATTSPGLRSGRFAPPVADPTGSGFGVRRILNGRPRAPHAGIDFHSPRGRPVHCSAAGRVAFAGKLYFTGRTVIVDHGEGLFTLYAHLAKLSCRVGQQLTAGAILGTVGSSGRATGPHLHWGARLRGARINPLALVAATGKSLDSVRAAGNNENSAPKGEP